MVRIKSILIVALIFAFTNNLCAQPTPHRIIVDDVDITPSFEQIQLDWLPTDSIHPETGKAFQGYRVYFGTDPEDLHFIGKTTETHFRHYIRSEHQQGFYKVHADYGERISNHVGRDDIVILDFEEDSLRLDSYNENEDVDVEEWFLSDEETLPESEQSLKLGGNCWKRLTLEDVLSLTDSTVWSIGILSVDGDTMADLQGIGLSDGENELFYAFHGLRNVWQEPWVVSYQDVYNRGRWQVYRMAVGYDWNIRYEHLPEIDQLFFINDNDNNDSSAVIYFDDLIDITESIPPQPIPQISWCITRGDFAPQGVGSGGAITFNSTLINRDPEDVNYLWDFGDGRSSEQLSPTHVYHRDGTYTVSLSVEDDDGQVGSARTNVEVGQINNQTQITIGCVGDVMMGRRYEQFGGIIERLGVNSIFEHVSERFTELDISIINLETVMSDEGRPHPIKDITLRCRPENVTGLTFAGFDLANLGNNHIYDYGERGLEETLEVLDAAGIGYSGAGLNEYQSLIPTFKTVRGIRVGLLGYCSRTGRDYNDRPYGDAGYDRYGFAYFSADNLLRSVPDAAEQCDLLVIYVHGGVEYEISPAGMDMDAQFPPDHEERIRFALGRDSATVALEHYAIELGAGLVMGGHPHVLQGFEVYEGAVIAHSLGNFAFDQNFFETWPSMLVCADVNRDGAVKVWVEPYFVDNYRPTPAVEGLGRKILDRLAGYSYEMNTIVVPNYDQMRAEVVIDPNQVARRVTEHTVSGTMRYFEQDTVYRSEPLRLDAGGFPSRIVSIVSNVDDLEWKASFGREIMLVGNMEHEGAQIWNYNSDNEGVDSDTVHGGLQSSYIIRQAGWQDGITDLTQRIPTSLYDRMTLCGWLKTENARDAGLVARYYRYRYNNDNENILGDQVAEHRLQDDNDWTYLWDQLIIPVNTEFMNIRWQLWGANEGQNQIWCDDVELIRWDEGIDFNRGISIDSPNDLYYLQLETNSEVNEVEVTYRTVTIEY